MNKLEHWEDLVERVGEPQIGDRITNDQYMAVEEVMSGLRFLVKAMDSAIRDLELIKTVTISTDAQGLHQIADEALNDVYTLLDGRELGE